MNSIPQTYKGANYKHHWDYLNLGGDAVMSVVRFDHPVKDGEGKPRKEIVPFTKDGSGKIIMRAHLEPQPLYNLPELLKADKGTPLFIVEGEKAAAALIGMGYLATTWQGGGNATGKTDWEPLDGFTRVYLLPDADQPGEAAMQAVAATLSAVNPHGTVKRVMLPDLPKGGDIVDWLQGRCEGWDGFEEIPSAAMRYIRDEWQAALTAHAEPLPESWLQTSQPSIAQPIAPLEPLQEAREREVMEYPKLPAILEDAAAEVSRFTKAPIEAAYTIGLSTLAVAIGKTAKVEERGGLMHYPSLFFMPIAGSGERKSPVFSNMQKPLADWKEENEKAADDARGRALETNDAIHRQIAKLRKEGERNGKTDIDEIQRLKKKRVTIPPDSRLYGNDATEERVTQLLHDHAGQWAVMTGEGRKLIQTILGLYSGQGNTGEMIYLAGITGDDIIRDRVGSETAGAEERIIRQPCLNVCIFVQPDIAERLYNDPRMQASGLVARILPAHLPSLVGTRFEEEREDDLRVEKLAPYYSRVEDILRHKNPEKKPHIARLSKEAKDLRRAAFNDIEMQQAKGQELEAHRDVASKIITSVCKIALILHLAEKPHHLYREFSEIGPETFQTALEIGRYHLKQAIRFKEGADRDPALTDAGRLLEWIKSKGGDIGELSATSIVQNGPSPRMKGKEAGMALEELAERGYLERIPPQGNRRKPRYKTNVAAI